MSPLFVALLFFVPQSPEIQVTGLKPGESFVELAPGREPVDERSSFTNYGKVKYIPGRVVDAFTRKPVAGAVVETWSEELNPYIGGFQRMGEALSGSDGNFRVERGEKARIMADGYLVWSGPGDDLWGNGVELFPAEERVPELLVIDTMGMPIYNAVVTSTYSCSHDVPAFEARSDSRGIVRLPGFGMQDHLQDLRIRAGGYAGTEYLWGKPALAMDGPLTVVMPRQDRQLEMQLFDTEGIWIKHEAVQIIDGECYHVGFTSDFGHVNFPYRYLAQDVTIKPVDKIRGYNYIGDIELIPEERIAFRLESDRWPEEDEAILQVVPPSAEMMEKYYADGELFHEHGWRESISTRDFEEEADPITFPSGEAYLHIGGGFHPYVEEWIELDLYAEETIQVQPQWKLQPSFSLNYPDDVKLLWREAGGFSDEFRNWEEEYFYPAGSRVVICGKVGDQTKYWELLQPQGEIDLLQCKELQLASTLPDRDNPVLNEVKIKVDAPLDSKGHWRLRNPFGSVDAPQPVDGEDHVYLLQAPELGPIIGEWSCSKYGGRRFKIIPGKTSELILKPLKNPDLEIECDQDYEYASLSSGVTIGQSELVLQFKDGRRLGLQLDFESGEERTIFIKTK